MTRAARLSSLAQSVLRRPSYASQQSRAHTPVPTQTQTQTQGGYVSLVTDEESPHPQEVEMRNVTEASEPAVENPLHTHTHVEHTQHTYPDFTPVSISHRSRATSPVPSSHNTYSHLGHQSNHSHGQHAHSHAQAHPRTHSHSHSSHSQQAHMGTERTESGGVSSVLPVEMLTPEQLSAVAQLSIQKAKLVSRQGWLQTKLAGSGAMKAISELERTIEMITLGAFYKYSSTAFVTFKSRVTESIAQQMLLSLEAMEIHHAPNPNDIIWDNVAIPKSQIVLRSYITDIGVIVGSIFWSSLVNSVNIFASCFPLPPSQQQMLSAVVMLVLLLILPLIFDSVARYYEGMKLESEIQNSIMTRYFYYQLINVYVTLGFSGSNLWVQILEVLQKPKTLIDILGGRMPDVSLFFTNLVIVKVFTAVPLEMIRPWQLSTIQLMGNCIDRRKTTRRDLRTGLFTAWPFLYGWTYPQLMMVLMIMLTYSVITPFIMPFCVLFFAFAYVLYKYQLLYVYINTEQSGGFMWYAVFSRSLVALEFASFCLLGYLALQFNEAAELSGPFFFMLPLPVCLIYFGRYCEHKFKKASLNLSYGFAKEIDHRNAERQAAHKPVPQDTFTRTLYRQPSLTDLPVYPEPYRNDGQYDILRHAETGESVVLADWNNRRMLRRGSLSINVHELTDEGEEDPRVLEAYFKEVVLPLSVIPQDNTSDEESVGSGGSAESVVLTRERR